jgi:hypothetical protein
MQAGRREVKGRNKERVDGRKVRKVRKEGEEGKEGK